MKRICFAAALALFIPVDSSAQPGRSCEPRAAIGAAAGLLINDFDVDGGLAGAGRSGLATTTGTGLEASVHGTVPISTGWSLKGEFGVGGMAVALKRDATGAYVKTRTGDDVVVQRLQVGLQHHQTGRALCGYVNVSVGMYRYNYRGTALSVQGAAATMGFEAPQTGAGALFFEIGMSVALTKLRAPTAAEAVVNIRPAIGWRYRF